MRNRSESNRKRKKKPQVNDEREKEIILMKRIQFDDFI